MGCIHVLKHEHAGASDDIFLAAFGIIQRYQTARLSQVATLARQATKLPHFPPTTRLFYLFKATRHGPHPRTYVLCTEKHTDRENEVLTTTESDNFNAQRLCILPIFCATIRYFWGRCILPVDTASLFWYNYV